MGWRMVGVKKTGGERGEKRDVHIRTRSVETKLLGTRSFFVHRSSRDRTLKRNGRMKERGKCTSLLIRNGTYLINSGKRDLKDLAHSVSVVDIAVVPWKYQKKITCAATRSKPSTGEERARWRKVYTVVAVMEEVLEGDNVVGNRIQKKNE
jgi:hypothetical protein